MPRYVSTGQARVYRDGHPGFLEMPLDVAQMYVKENPGCELYGVMREADGE